MPESIEQLTLGNGLRVVEQSIPGVTGVGISVNYGVGFRTETVTRSGFAHLFEHMMFQGSANVAGGEHFARVQAYGGFVNGNTFPDVTDYHQVVPAAALREVLELEADRMSRLAVTERNFATQRDVVKEEIRLQVAGRPYGGFPWIPLPSVLYDKWQNTHNGYGETADLDAASVEECVDFYSRHYAPGNAVLAVCGAVEPGQGLALAERCFGPLEPRPVPEPIDITEPPAPTTRTATCEDALAPRPALALGCRLPDARADLAGYAAFVLLSRLLTGASSSRLRRAFAPLGAVVDSSVGLFGPLVAKDPDTFVVVAHHPQGAAGAALATIEEQCAEVASGGAGEAEVAQAQAAAVTELYQNLDSLAYRVRFLARGALLFDRPGIAEDLARAVAATDAGSLAAAAAAVCRPEGRAVLNLVPKGDR
ncbi:peptidase M16 [Kitasatospora xanthocidica]|uniref:M16 family metallopeptidase n=1 Tax=Kitasatospora xanthocidica TaxID=83382 RepID=UPI0019A96E44|nr:pitrilysin family protein [Kitasatospora xanthocidica]GHF64472.1 peptidase M16 [Kitasatospora xanthocidica]